MPRDYGKITHRFWTGDTGKKMREESLEVRAVATYLLSCGSSNMIGLYYLPVMLISHEVGSGLTLEGASKALRRLGELEFAHYDESEEVVFVPHMAREQIADHMKPNDKQRHGVIALLIEHKKSRFYADFVAIYRDSYHLEELAERQAPSKGLPRPIEDPSKPGEQESRRTGAETGEQAPSKPIGKTRPRSANDLEHCLRVAVEREQPQAGRWLPGRFSTKDADKILRDMGDIEAALPELERKIELFSKDPDMQPWSVAKFHDKYNAIGLPKLEFGRAPDGKPKPKPGQPAPFRWPDLPGVAK